MTRPPRKWNFPESPSFMGLLATFSIPFCLLYQSFVFLCREAISVPQTYTCTFGFSQCEWQPKFCLIFQFKHPSHHHLTELDCLSVQIPNSLERVSDWSDLRQGEFNGVSGKQLQIWVMPGLDKYLQSISLSKENQNQSRVQNRPIKNHQIF